MSQSGTPEGLLDGVPEEVEEIRSWIRLAGSSYRSRLGSELEDMEQEILVDLTVALRAGKFDGRSSFKTYVRAFATHKCIDKIRSLSRRQWVDVEDLELQSTAPSALEELSRRDVRRLAQEVMESLGEECRDLWRMLEEGMRYQEMAERTGVASGTLRVRVLRCRQKATKLREKILARRNETRAGTTT